MISGVSVLAGAGAGGEALAVDVDLELAFQDVDPLVLLGMHMPRRAVALALNGQRSLQEPAQGLRHRQPLARSRPRRSGPSTTNAEMLPRPATTFWSKRAALMLVFLPLSEAASDGPLKALPSGSGPRPLTSTGSASTAAGREVR